MAEFPSLPLFTDSWVADTKHLTRLERGTYMDLLILMWRTPQCRVPNDDAWLAKRLGMTVEEIKVELRPVVGEFCSTTGNWLFQKRLRKEWEWCGRMRQRNSDAANARWDKEKGPSERRTASHSPLPIPTHKKKDSQPSVGARRPKSKARHQLPQDWVPSERDIAYATERSFDHQAVLGLVRRFENHHRSKGNLMADWAAAWRTWVENEIKFAAERGGPKRPGGAAQIKGPSFFDISMGDFKPGGPREH